MGKVLGQSVKRSEDPRMITGEAKYIDDVKLPGMAHAAILRSAHAHARIKSIDISKAAEFPGVVGVFTGKDFEDIPALPCAWQAAAGRIQNNLNMPRVLEIDRVTSTGAAIAVVVAEDRYTAEDALALIEVDYEPLATVVDAEKATQSGAPQLHENAPNNICFDWNIGDLAAADRGLAEADVTVKQRLINQRLIPTPIDMRGAVAQYNPANEDYTLWLSTQTPHIMRLLITAFVFGIPETKMRVIAPQIGGGFGTKISLYPRISSDGCVGQGGRPSGEMGGNPDGKLCRHFARSRSHYNIRDWS